MTRTIIITLALLLLSGCGNDITEGNESETKEVGQHDDESKQAAPQTDEPDTLPLPKTLTGYVTAIDLEVDSVVYGAGGSEAFYTATVERLRAEADDAGFASHDLNVMGKLGLGDFSFGMKVIGASETFAFEKVLQDGRFKVNLPETYGGEPITVRAIRRVEVQLVPPTRDEEKVVWCYNLLSDVTVSPWEQSAVVVRVFHSSLTKYACGTNGGMSIPVNAKQPSTATDESVVSEAQ